MAALAVWELVIVDCLHDRLGLSVACGGPEAEPEALMRGAQPGPLTRRTEPTPGRTVETALSL